MWQANYRFTDFVPGLAYTHAAHVIVGDNTINLDVFAPSVSLIRFFYQPPHDLSN